MSVLHRALLRDLWHLRGQVVSAALVMAMGVASFVAMVCTDTSLERARDEYYAEYRFADVFAHLRRAPNGLMAELDRIPGVAVTESRIVEDVSLNVAGLDEPATGRLVSLPTDGHPLLNRLFLRHGRLPNPASPDEAVVSETFARANALRVGGRVGAILNGRWRNLEIVGIGLSPEYVYEVASNMIFPDNRRFGVLWMGRDALAAAFDMDGAFNDLTVQLQRGAPSGPVVDQLDRMLAPYGGLLAYDRREQTSNRFLADELAEIRVHATYIPAIFLAVSIFLLHTLLARLVATERSQIALLKSFGFADGRIGLHYVEFALAIVVLGLIAGLALGEAAGIGLTAIYRDYFHFPQLRFQILWPIAAASAAIAVSAALAASIGSVGRAVRLPPAESIRPEPPHRYRAAPWESAGWYRRIGPAGRVIVRNLARRPGRAVLSSIGIALAIATIIVGRFAFDAVNTLVAIHFSQAQREDATVTLRSTSSHRAVAALARMPGVLHAEAYRTVPVRIRFAHRSKRVALVGILPDADLRQIVDSRGRHLAIPPDGLVLTRKLAEILGVAPGDRVAIEQLDGRRASAEEPVVRLSDEPLGVAGYMDARALSRWLRDDGEVSGALLEVESTRVEALFAALKRTPAIGSVMFRSAMLNTVRDTMNRSFLVMTVTMTIFSAVLVFGVVYNSARIALSERGHELACLRVLGFHKSEVIALLLGEQALLTALAIPLGGALGTMLCRLLVPLFDREFFRLPFSLSSRTYALATLTTLAAALASGALVAVRVGRLDLVSVLKSRE